MGVSTIVGSGWFNIRGGGTPPSSGDVELGSGKSFSSSGSYMCEPCTTSPYKTLHDPQTWEQLKAPSAISCPPTHPLVVLVWSATPIASPRISEDQKLMCWSMLVVEFQVTTLRKPTWPQNHGDDPKSWKQSEFGREGCNKGPDNPIGPFTILWNDSSDDTESPKSQERSIQLIQ